MPFGNKAKRSKKDDRGKELIGRVPPALVVVPQAEPLSVVSTMASGSLPIPHLDRGFLNEIPSDLEFPDSLLDTLNFGDGVNFNIDDLISIPENELELSETYFASSWLDSGSCDPGTESNKVASGSDLRDLSQSGVSVVRNPPTALGRYGSDASTGFKCENTSPLPEHGCSSQGSFTTGSGDASGVGDVKPEDSPISSPDLSGNGNDKGIDHSEDSVSRAEKEPEKSRCKRKKEQGEDANSSIRTKFSRSDCSPVAESHSLKDNEEDEKRRARLVRNRESAQLSRQRKKHYVEELEDKVRCMTSTIKELNSRIACMTAENANLRQQLGPQTSQPNVFPPPPLSFPWIACPPYAFVPQNGVVYPPGSQVPLVPIPRWKPQQLVSAPKAKKSSLKEDSIKGTKKPSKVTKKVASVTFICFLMFLVYSSSTFSVMNFMYGDKEDTIRGRFGFVDSEFGNRTSVRVLTGVNGRNGTKDVVGMNYLRKAYFERCMRRGREGWLDPQRLCRECSSLPFSGSNGDDLHGNASESMVASLYVPRNDKLVRIDGELIIRSVLASQRSVEALKSWTSGDVIKGREAVGMDAAGKNGLAIKSVMQPALPSGKDSEAIIASKRSAAMHQKALASGSGGAYSDHRKVASSFDGPLQQWFREGIAGRVLGSGTCTEVFQFEVSAATKNPTTIISSASSRESDTSGGHHHLGNDSNSNMVHNRRFLYPTAIPLPGKTLHNRTADHSSSNNENASPSNNSVSSSMVVSILPDPRDTGDNGNIKSSTRSLPRILVVVLVDSVKYATYSCMLPFQNSSPRL